MLLVVCVIALGGGMLGAAMGDTDSNPVVFLHGEESNDGPNTASVDGPASVQAAGEGEPGENLLENSDCMEYDDEEFPDNPTVWVPVEESDDGFECFEDDVFGGGDLQPPAQSGDRYFAESGETDVSILEQTVDIDGGTTYQLSGWYGKYELYEADHFVQFEVRYYDDDGDEFEEYRLESDELVADSFEEMEEFVDTATAPDDAEEAAVRIVLDANVDSGTEMVDVVADDVQLRPLSDAPTAFDVSGVETGIEQTYEPEWTLFDDEFGEDEDDRGFDDDAEISHFGGGDLGGSVTDNEAGDTVSVAGGDLQVNADGSFSLTNPTQTGTFEFAYRLEYEDDHDDATVTIEIFDHELESPKCEEWDENEQDRPIGWDKEGGLSCYDPEDLPWTESDHTAVGDRSFTDNYIDLDDEVETEQTVYVISGETYTVSGLYGTDSDDYAGEVEFEYLDADGDVISDEGFALDELQSESTTNYDRFTETTDAPGDAKRATLRLTVVRPSGHEDPAGVYFDDLSIEAGDPGDDPVNARNVETEVGIYHTFEPDETLFDDWGNGADELGSPEAELVNFGGGDLSGDVTENDPGDEVSFAGGTLTVEDDGTFSLDEPTETGTHSFEYEIENDHDSSTATVEFWVRDSTLLDADCDPDTFDAWDDVSPAGGGIGCIDPQRSGEVDPNGEQNPPVPPYAIGDTVGDGEDAIAEQTVPVRGGFTYELAGYVGTEETPEDSHVTLEVEYLDEDGAALSLDDEHEVDLSEMRSDETTAFDAFSDTTVAPEDATHATIRISVNNAAEMDLGGDAYARAYADDLSFEEAPLTIDGTVTDETTDEPIEGASMELEAGGETVDDAVTGADGTYEFEEVDPETTYDLAVEAAGYQDADETMEVEGTDKTHDIELAGNASMSGTVEDATLDGIPAVEVTVSGEQGEYTATTDEEGAYTVDGVAGTDEVYTVSADPDSWNDNSTTVTVGDGEAAQVDLTLTGPRTNTIEAHDRLFEHAGDEYRIGTATVVIEHSTYGAEPTFGTGAVTTESDGSSVDVALPTMPTHLAPGGTLGDDELRYTASADGYESATDTESLDFDVSMRVTIGGNAEVSGTVIDEGTGDGIEDATVEIDYPSGEAVVFEDATDSDGAYTIEDVPGTGEEYELTVSVDGYESNATALVVGDGENVEHDVELSGTASVSGSVEDTTFETGVEGVQIAVENGAGTYTTETDENGEYTVEGVAGTGETYTVDVDQEGWQEASTTETLGDGEEVTDVDFEITGDATDGITLRDAETDDRLDGATVTITHDEVGVAEDAFTADGDGNMEIVLPGGFTYSYTFTQPGYDSEEIPLRSFDPGTSQSANYVLDGNAEIAGQITDSQSDAGIEDVAVTAENGAGEYTATTDESGIYTVENVPGGHGYDVTIDADGYETVVESDVSIGDEATHTLDDELTGTATLSGTVTDELFEVSLDGVEVDISGEQEYVVETDENGEYTATVAGTGEEYTVTADPDGWVEASETVELGDGDTEDGVDFDLIGDATAELTVEDAETGTPIDGATVIAENGTLGESDPFETDGEGGAEVTPLPGEFIYDFTIEASGYDDDGLTGVFLAEGASENRTHGLSGNAEITGQVTDDVFGTSVEGVTVTVDNGEDEYTATTDENGAYTVESVPGTDGEYDLTVDEEGYELVEETVTVGDEASVTQDLVVSGDAEITGTVTDGLTEEGIEDATVTAENGAGTYDATTDENGEYTIENVPGEATYDLVADHDDYETDDRSNVSVAAGEQRTESVVLDPTAEATLAGTVTDDVTGEPIADATVTGTLDDAAAETELVYETTTAADGSYEVDEVVGSYDYTVTVNADGYETGSTSAAVAEDGTTEIDVTAVGNASVGGIVEDAVTETELADATVTVSGEQGSYTAETDENGAFTVEDVAGTGEEYEIDVSADGYGSNATTTAIDDDETVENTAVELFGNASVSGTISETTFEGGVEGIEVTVSGDQGEYTTDTDEQGEYTVENVPGTGESYSVSVDPTGWVGKMEPVTIGDDDDVTGPDFELTGDADDTITISDQVTGAEIENATVAIEHAAFGEIDVLTDGDGEAAVTVPGDQRYDYTVSKSGYDEGTQPEIPFDPGQSRTTNLSLSGSGELIGKLTDAKTGEGIEGATVTAENGAGTYEATTDESGLYTISAVPGGQPYDVTVRADGYDAVTESDVLVQDSATTEQEFALAGNASITGIVEGDLGGEPIENAELTVIYPSGDAFTVEDATDADGGVTIENVPGTGDEYDLHVRATGYDDTEVTQSTVGSGETVNAGTIELTGNADLSGTIVDGPSGNTLSDIEVTVAGEGDVFETTVQTDENGEYVAETIPGAATYNVTISEGGYNETEGSTWQAQTVDDAESVTGVDLTAAGDTPVTLAFEDGVTGEPITEPLVTFDHDEIGTVDRTLDEQSSQLDDWLRGEQEYDVTVERDGYETTTLTVETDESVGETIALYGDATIGGTVEDTLTDEPIEEATVTAENGAGTYDATTTGSGEYTIENLPGGIEYDVTASHDQYESETEPGVESDGTASFELIETAEATVSGTVTDAETGSAVESAAVEIEREDGAITYDAETDSDGSYEIPDVIGEYDYAVTVTANGYDDWTDTNAVSDDGVTELDASLVGSGAVTGTVVDATADGQPGIEDAAVTVTAPTGTETLDAVTDADGTFTVENLPDTGDEYEVTAVASGYDSNETAVIVADGTADAGSIELTGSARITGSVEDTMFETGVDGIEVTADGKMTNTYRVETDGDGEYAMSVPDGDNADDGEYAVSVDPAGWESAETTVDVGDGDATDTDLVVTGTAGLDEAVVLDDVTDEPLDEVSVTVEHGAFGVAEDVAVSDEGEVSVRAPGTGESLSIAFSKAGYGDETYAHTDGEGLDSPTVRLAGTATVGGDVTNAVTDEPINGATVCVENGAGTYETTTDADGSYEIENVPGTGDTYDLTVEATGYDASASAVTIADGATLEEDSSLAGDGEVTVTVIETYHDDPDEDATIEFTDDDGNSYPVTETGDGVYVVEDVPSEGEYTVSADAVDHHGDDATVEMTVGEDESVELFLDREKGTITGTVTDEFDGEPLESVEVQVGETTYNATTDPDGGYEIENVPTGAYTVTIDLDDYATVEESVTVSVDETTTVDAVLAPDPGSISGTVTGLDEEMPIDGATVTLTNATGDESASTTAGGDGSYHFDAVPRDDGYVVAATAPDYVGNETTVDVEPGQAVEDVDVPLALDAVLDVTEIDAPPEIEQGEPVVVTATVTNLGEVSGTTDLDYEVAGTPEASEDDLTLAGGESTDVEFTYDVADDETPGEYVHTVRTDEGHEQSAAVRVLAPANFSVGIDDVNAPAAGHTLNVTATITNTGNLTASQPIALAIDDHANQTAEITPEETIDTHDLTLGGGETETIVLSWATTTSDDGEYVATVASLNTTDHANVTIDEPFTPPQPAPQPDPDPEPDPDPQPTPETEVVDVTATPETVATDEPVTVTAALETVGATTGTGTHDVDLLVNGELDANESVDVPADETVTVEFVKAFDDPGEYELAVDDHAHVVAVEEPTETPTPAQTETPTPEPTETPTPGPTETPTDESSTDDEDTPGFGVPLTVVALLTALVLGRSRRITLVLGRGAS